MCSIGTATLMPHSGWMAPHQLRPLTLETALRPPARRATDYDADEYTDMLEAYEQAARVLKVQAKARATPSSPQLAPSSPIAKLAPAPPPSSPTPASQPANSADRWAVRLEGSLEDLLVSIAPKMSRALPSLLEAGVECVADQSSVLSSRRDVATLLRLRADELAELLAITDLLPFDRIVLASRLRPYLA